MPGLATQSAGGALTPQSLATLQLISASMFPTQGNIWFVAPGTGSDNNAGTAASPFATVAHALAMATANQNDIIYLLAQNNTAGLTTDYQTATLKWNKDLTHLIGVNSGPLFSQRSRIAFNAAYVGTGEMFTLSANGCLIQGIEFFMGVASANPVGCMTISGSRNRISRCHIAGMGNAANDISGAYSLQLNGAEENLIEDCTIGQDTIQLGAGTSNSVMLFSNTLSKGNTRNWFRNCRFMLDTSSATVALFLRAGATTMDRENVIEDCLFLNAINSGSTTLTHAMAVVAGTSPAGVLILTGAKTGLFGATGWNATSGILFATGGPIPVAGTYGTGVAITS